MTQKTIMIGLVALAFVAGSIMTGTMAYASGDKNGKPFEAIWEAIHNLETGLAEIELTPGPQGEQGEPGPAGSDGADGSSCSIDGTIVSCTDGTSSDVQGQNGIDGMFPQLYTNTSFSSSSPVTVNCDSGDLATGGGGVWGNGDSIGVNSDWPQLDINGNANGWIFSSTVNAETYQVWVICADITP